MKATLIIPARFGSSRFPGKPLALINNKPMIQHVYERASLAEGVSNIYVATDDERIANTVTAFGGKVVMTSANAASGTDRLQQAAEILNLADDELIINLQGDQPLINPQCIEQLIRLFHEEPGEFHMATLGVAIKDLDERDDPMHVKMVFDNQDFAIYFSRAKIPFGRDINDYPLYKHLGIYAYTKGFLNTFAKLPVGRLEAIEKLEQLRALENGFKIKVAIGDFSSPEVDVPADIAKCEAYLLNN